MDKIKRYFSRFKLNYINENKEETSFKLEVLNNKLDIMTVNLNLLCLNGEEIDLQNIINIIMNSENQEQEITNLRQRVEILEKTLQDYRCLIETQEVRIINC